MPEFPISRVQEVQNFQVQVEFKFSENKKIINTYENYNGNKMAVGILKHMSKNFAFKLIINITLLRYYYYNIILNNYYCNIYLNRYLHVFDFLSDFF